MRPSFNNDRAVFLGRGHLLLFLSDDGGNVPPMAVPLGLAWCREAGPTRKEICAPPFVACTGDAGANVDEVTVVSFDKSLERYMELKDGASIGIYSNPPPRLQLESLGEAQVLTNVDRAQLDETTLQKIETHVSNALDFLTNDIAECDELAGVDVTAFDKTKAVQHFMRAVRWVKICNLEIATR